VPSLFNFTTFKSIIGVHDSPGNSVSGRNVPESIMVF
jgi:hypothetical protein